MEKDMEIWRRIWRRICAKRAVLKWQNDCRLLVVAVPLPVSVRLQN